MVLQVNVNTALPYVRLVPPSRFMGGASCEIVPTNINVVVDELVSVPLFRTPDALFTGHG